MLTTGETAQLLGVTAQTVINWIEGGKIPAVRVGRGRRRVTFATLRQFVEQNRIPAQVNAPDLWERVQADSPRFATSLPPVIGIDGAGRIVFWNEKAEQMLGWTSLQ